MNLVDLWKEREKLRNLWRGSKDEIIIIGIKFGMAQEEWANMFREFLIENGIELQEGMLRTKFIDKSTGNELIGKELKEKLESLIGEKLVQLISFDYSITGK